MVNARLLLYIVGTFFALMVAGRLYNVRNWLAHALCFAMLCWALNMIFLFVLLYTVTTTGDRPAWTEFVAVANAVWLCLAPLLILVQLLLINGETK